MKRAFRAVLTKTNRGKQFDLQAGVSLIEVLVAVVIFSFGILALAGLQLNALKYQKGAWSRAGATTAIVDLSEKMQANRFAARDGDYNLGGSYTELLGSPPEPSGCDATVGRDIVIRGDNWPGICAPNEIAQNDLNEWFSSISENLPQGVGRLTGDAVNGFVATVMWFDKDAVNADGEPVASVTCAPNDLTTTCCPANANVPAGVRCVNSAILP
jgi:type IV pilus assembly protein PilV